MSKIAVLYWSGTGNTQAMAEAVAEGASENGAQVQLFTPSEFGTEGLDAFDAAAFGCPAMGDEVLEESEFAPLFDSIKGQLAGKRIALFGSYGWGDGEWMRTWEADCTAAGAVFAADSVIVNDAPDDDGIAACRALGAALAE